MTLELAKQRARWTILFIAIGLIVLGIILWRFTSLAEFATTQRLSAWLGQFSDQPWAPFAMIGLFVIGGLLMFPLLLLVGTSALLLDPWVAFAVSLTGALASALITYAVGACFVRNTAHSAFGPTLKRLSTGLATRGVIAIAIIRMLPIAPFTLVNVAAGSIGVKLRDYAIGTAVGLTPGVLAITALGKQLRSVVDHPTIAKMIALLAIMAAWIGLSLLLQRWVSRKKQMSTG